MLRVLLACDSFKGTIASHKVGEAAERGLRLARLQSSHSTSGPLLAFMHCPMSDGGDGLIECLTSRRTAALNDEQQQLPIQLRRVRIPLSYTITGPLGKPVTTPVYFACDLRQRVVVVEMAEAAGLARVPSAAQRSPWEATSYGVGEIIQFAVEYVSAALERESLATSGSTLLPTAAGVTVLLGIGGSATNDGGLGALQALGLDIFLEDPESKAVNRLKGAFRGRHLPQLHHVELTDRLRRLFGFKGGADRRQSAEGIGCYVEKMFLICDVENPLVGPQGATYTFGPQKCSPVVDGVDDTEDAAVGEVKSTEQHDILDQLEEGMRHAARRVVSTSWESVVAAHNSPSGPNTRVELERELLDGPRGGAAGGMSGFFRYVLGTSCLPGADIVAALQGLRAVDSVPWDRNETTRAEPTGLLYDDWDTLVTGEGSFDEQSIFSHKTVGRLLEMVVEANAWRWKQHLERPGHSSTPPRLLLNVLIVCGRCGFESNDAAWDALHQVLRQETPPKLRCLIPSLSRVVQLSPDELVRRLMPRLMILPLVNYFSLGEAMGDPAACIAKVRTRRALSKGNTERQVYVCEGFSYKYHIQISNRAFAKSGDEFYNDFSETTRPMEPIQPPSCYASPSFVWLPLKSLTLSLSFLCTDIIIILVIMIAFLLNAKGGGWFSRRKDAAGLVSLPGSVSCSRKTTAHHHTDAYDDCCGVAAPQTLSRSARSQHDPLAAISDSPRRKYAGPPPLLSVRRRREGEASSQRPQQVGSGGWPGVQAPRPQSAERQAHRVALRWDRHGFPQPKAAPEESLRNNGEAGAQDAVPSSPWLELEEALSVVQDLPDEDLTAGFADPLRFHTARDSAESLAPKLDSKTSEPWATPGKPADTEASEPTRRRRRPSRLERESVKAVTDAVAVDEEKPWWVPSTSSSRSALPTAPAARAAMTRETSSPSPSPSPSIAPAPVTPAAPPAAAPPPPLVSPRSKRATTRTRKIAQSTMFSSVNHARFKQAVQDRLRAAAAEMESNSMFWITRAQAMRTGNTVVMPGEKPTIIHLAVSFVVPLLSLPKAQQTQILDEHPPFFGTGVGILSERRKWKVVSAARLIRRLNPQDEDRALYVDTEIAEAMKLQYRPEDVLDIRKESAVEVYNATQLFDPYKGEPQRGVAINSITGKRFPQPAHDMLLAVGLLRGYTSPFWIGEKQLKYLNLELNKKRAKEGVLASDMSGLVVPLSSLPPPCIRLLLGLLRHRHPDAFHCDLFFLFGVNGWEASRSRVLVKHMAAIEDRKFPYFFVNILDFALQYPKLGASLYASAKRLKPFGREYVEAAAAKFLAEEAKAIKLGVSKQRGPRRKAEDNDTLPSGLRFVRTERLWKTKVRCFFAEDVTMRRYYNACCTTKPHLAFPAVRPIAIFNGRLMGRRDETILRSQSLKYKFSSPLWLTEVMAHKMGVNILPKQKKKFAVVGPDAVDSGAHGDEVADGFYNIDDFPSNETILSMFPKSSKNVHFMLDGKWRPVLGNYRQEYLASLKRPTPLWISMSECLMSGFEPRPGATMCSFPKQSKGSSASRAQRLYNSQQTTDPVRVIGLATLLTRPQGLRV
eukprot:gene2105-1283_t